MKCKILVVAMIFLLACKEAYGQETMIIFQENFDSQGLWFADNGVWEVGRPTVGPDSCHSPKNCAGTILNNNYPSNANTRLISPEVRLPSIGGSEEIQLRFWQWFRLQEFNATFPHPFDPDQGRIQISVNGGELKNIAGPFSGISEVWSQVIVDLSAYADSTLRIAFYFTSSGNNQDEGWYVDDISITKSIVTFNNPDNFELGIGNWSVDNGLWEVGSPTAGPDTCYSPPNCAGTALDSNYPPHANTRLVSPEITLIPKEGQNPGLFLRHWFRLREFNATFPHPRDPDEGRIQISVNGGDWKTEGGPFTGISEAWTQAFVDLSAYADSTVRIALYFTSSGNNEDNGWYVDDIRIEGINITSVGESEAGIPTEFSLQQNFPNPFNPQTNIRYHLAAAAHVELEIYNTLGQRIRTLVNQHHQAGNYQITWDGKNRMGQQVASGLYMYRLKSGEFVQTMKMLLLR